MGDARLQRIISEASVGARDRHRCLLLITSGDGSSVFARNTSCVWTSVSREIRNSPCDRNIRSRRRNRLSSFPLNIKVISLEQSFSPTFRRIEASVYCRRFSVSGSTRDTYLSRYRLLSNKPSCLLFQTCYEMERYLKDEPKLQSYKKLPTELDTTPWNLFRAPPISWTASTGTSAQFDPPIKMEVCSRTTFANYYSVPVTIILEKIHTLLSIHSRYIYISHYWQLYYFVKRIMYTGCRSRFKYHFAVFFRFW